MTTVDIGTTTTVSWTNAQASAALTVTAPDGTTTTPTVTTASGKHTAPVPTVQAGRHLLSWAAPAAGPTTKFVDILDVWPVDPRFLVSMDEAAAALRWRAADIAARGDDLRLYNAAATEVIEDIAGAVLVRTVEQFADGGDAAVLLWHLPSEITSVTVDGVAAVGWIADLSAAVVYAGPGVRFASGRQNVKITYEVGSADIPPSIRAAVRILLRHMTTVDQAPVPISGNPVNQASETAPTPSGFMVPRRVLELVENRRTLPGLA